MTSMRMTIAEQMLAARNEYLQREADNTAKRAALRAEVLEKTLEDIRMRLVQGVMDGAPLDASFHVAYAPFALDGEEICIMDEELIPVLKREGLRIERAEHPHRGELRRTELWLKYVAPVQLHDDK